MKKRSVVIRESYVPMFETATDEQVGKLVKAMLAYQQTGKAEIEDPMMAAVFAMIREGIDEDNAEYEKTCKRRKDAADKRWGNDTPADESMQEHASACNSMQEHASASESMREDADMDLDVEPKASKDAGGIKRTRKHKHGEFGHVLLTDEELAKLEERHGAEKTAALIKILDEAIEIKGYKYKSHYLVLLTKWPLRVYEEQNKPQAPPGNDRPMRQTYVPFDHERKDNDYDSLQKELARKTREAVKARLQGASDG